MLVFLLLLACVLWPSLVPAATINAASCTPAAVATAISAAAVGDTVHLPTCVQSWDTMVTITKRIILEGNGTGNTILQRSAGGALIMFRVTGVTGFEMRNMTLDGTFDTHPDIHRDIGLNLNQSCVDFRIHHMAFTDLSEGMQVQGDPLVMRGLIDNNTFTDMRWDGVGTGATGYGVQMIGNGTYPALSLGTAQNVFLEDNTHTRNRHAVAANNGTRYVFRHNTIVRNSGASLNAAAIDAHGYTGSWPQGTRQYEIYNNTVTDSTTQCCGVGIRGGDGVIFNNVMTPMSSNREVYLLNDSGCGGTYPKEDQIRELYIWNNTRHGGAAANVVITGGCEPTIQLNRDYFLTARPGYTPYTYPHPGQGGASPVPDFTTGLRMHLKFDENTGTTAQDSTVNNHDGTLVSGAGWGAAQLGASALALDGTADDYVTVTGGLTNPTSATLAAWVFPTGWPTGTNEVINLRNAIVLRLTGSNGSVRGSYYTGTAYVGITVNAGLALNTWHHIAYTMAPGSQRVYVNGTLVGSGSSGSPVVYTGLPADTRVGSHMTDPTAFRFQGRIDDVRVYTRALTATDIAGLAALEDPPPLSIQITTPTTSPSHSTSAALLANVGGVATDDTGVTGVTWTCPTCSTTSGPADCTPACGAAATDINWNIPSITFPAAGTHLITVTAADASTTRSDTLTATYTPPGGGGGAACTHYASSETAPAAGFAAGLQGNTGTSQSSPKRVVDMWSMLTPGKVLCLLDGTYTGGNSLLQVPSTVNGTPSQPVTIRALNDGTVVINGGTARPIQVLGNHIHIQGVDASGGDNATCPLNGSFGKLSRVVCYEGGSTAATSGFRFGGPNNVLEDVAWFGRTKKGINCGADYLGVGNNTVRRAFSLYTDSDPAAGNPTNTYEAGYGQDRCTLENVIGTWDTKPGGGVGDPEGVLETFRTVDSAILGSIFYVRAAAAYPSHRVFFGLKDAGSGYQAGSYHPMQNMVIRDVVAMVEPGHPSFGTISAWGLAGASSGPPGVNNLADNTLGVSGQNDPISGDGGWTRTAYRHGTSVNAALSGSGHTSVWTLMPGLCKQYVDRTLTTTGLWPNGLWPMNQRIKNAMARAGKTPIDVTATMQALFGPIPVACTGGTAPETCTPPLVGTPPNCACPAGTVPPNCEPETPAETCPPDCPVQDTFVIATTGSPGPLGNDLATCTLEAPCATINRARSLMTPGDTLYLRGGTYTGANNRITTSTGAFPAGNDWSTPTRIAAYGGETVVLQQSTGTVITVNNPATDRYLVFDRLIVDGATTGGNDTQGVVMSGGAHHVRWQNGTIRNTHFTGLTITDASAVEVLNTTIHGSSHGSGASVTGASDSVLFDGVTLYSNASHGLNAAHSGLTNLTVRNSVSRNNTSTGFLLGASNLLATNLLAYGNALGVRLTSVTVDGKLYHATVADNSGVEVQVDAGATDTELVNVIAVGGIVNNGTGTIETTNLYTDPGFIGGGNYHLALDTSPAIDEGTCLPGVVDVALDTIPRPQPTGGECDIGSFEQVGDDAEPPLPTPGALSARPWGSRLLLIP